MNTFHFFLGNGWISPWYLVFYVLGLIPSLLFLGFFRRSRTFGPGEGLAVTYSIGSTLLFLLSSINGFLLAKGLSFTSEFKYPLILLSVGGAVVLFRLFTLRCIKLDLFDRKHSWMLHLFVFSLLFLNLYSLWIFQNRHLG